MSVGISWFLPEDFESPEKYQAAKDRKAAAETAQAIVDETIRAETNAREAPGLAAAAHEFWDSASSRRSIASEPAVPEPGSQEEIDILERKIPIAKEELDQFLQHSRFDALERQLRSGKLFGAVLVQVEHFVNSWRPVRENLGRTVQELTRQHGELIARRREAAR